MSREAAGDGQPDVAEEVGPTAMASESGETGEASVTGEASAPRDAGRRLLPDDYDGIPMVDDSAAAPDDGDAGGRGAGGPGETALGETALGEAELGEGEFGEAEFGEAELVQTEPGEMESGEAELVQAELVQAELVQAELVQAEWGEAEFGAGGHGEEDEEVPGTLLEMAELVEFDEPGRVLASPRRWPRLLLALGFVLLAAVIVGGAIAIVGSVTHGFKKPVKVTYTKSPVFSLKTGECIDPQGQSYTLVSCNLPHEAEVFATFNLTGSDWPGSPAVAAAASSGCSTRLAGYLNPQLAVSLASTYVYPDATAWQAGTRTVICEVKAASGQLTGSVRGATATAG